jgi:hypothetical protein
MSPVRERRIARRYRLPLSVAITKEAALTNPDIINGKIRNISCSGLYFTSPGRLTVGDKFDLSMILPGRGIASSDILVEALVKAVRIEQELGNEDCCVGVAAVIEAYRIVRTNRSAC